MPQYKRIYNSLLEEISSGRLKSGDQIPSEKKLCEAFKVSRITAKRALELLAEQGYVLRFPGKGSFVSESIKAKSSQGMGKTLALLIPDFSDAFGINLLNGILDTCTGLGYHLILKRTRDRIREEENSIRSLVETGTAGFLIVPVHGEFYNPEILKLSLDNKPLVFVDRKMQGIRVPSVSTDNQEGAALGVEYLFRLGHRKIGFYSGPIKDTSSVEKRRDGFIQAFGDFEIKYKHTYFCHSLHSPWTSPFYKEYKELADVDVQQVSEHIKSHPELTAAFVAEYRMALLVHQAVMALGRKVPEDFSILTFDCPPSILTLPPYTHLLQDEYTIGQRAVEGLRRIILGEDSAAIEDILVPAKLIFGASTAPLQ